MVKDAHSHNGITLEFIRLMERLKLRKRGFYALRHTFRTVADEIPDARAIDRILGHVSAHISADYVEFIDSAQVTATSNRSRPCVVVRHGEAAST